MKMNFPDRIHVNVINLNLSVIIHVSNTTKMISDINNQCRYQVIDIGIPCTEKYQIPSIKYR